MRFSVLADFMRHRAPNEVFCVGPGFENRLEISPAVFETWLFNNAPPRDEERVMIAIPSGSQLGAQISAFDTADEFEIDAKVASLGEQVEETRVENISITRFGPALVLLLDRDAAGYLNAGLLTFSQ